MIIRFADLKRPRVGRIAAVTSMLVLCLGFAPAAVAQDVKALANPQSDLAEKYPGLRALVIARGDCIAFEYYRKGIGAETQSHVQSVTKSVLSILIGIAIDEGYLRLDQKLSEIFPEAFDENTDPRARDITVADVLTKTEGFAVTNPGDFKVSDAAPNNEMWRWM